MRTYNFKKAGCFPSGLSALNFYNLEFNMVDFLCISCSKLVNAYWYKRILFVIIHESIQQ